MAKEKILVVDDEDAILELVRYNLVSSGYDVICAASGDKALHAVESERPNLVILDLMLPEINGLDVCRRLKADAKSKDIPIIILSAKGEEADIVIGLELGAADYVTKPFSPRILVARVRAVLRKPKESETHAQDLTVFSVHNITIDVRRHEVSALGKPLELNATEFRVLCLLAKNPGWVYTRGQIVEAVHGDDYPVTDRSVDVQIAGLRKKLGKCGEYIETVWGVGYRFKE